VLQTDKALLVLIISKNGIEVFFFFCYILMKY